MKELSYFDRMAAVPLQLLSEQQMAQPARRILLMEAGLVGLRHQLHQGRENKSREVLILPLGRPMTLVLAKRPLLQWLLLKWRSSPRGKPAPFHSAVAMVPVIWQWSPFRKYAKRTNPSVSTKRVLFRTRKHSNRMRMARLPTVGDSVATWCQYPGALCSEVSSDCYQMSLVEGRTRAGWGEALSAISGRGGWDGGGALYCEVQCIMGNGHMGTPSLWTDTTENITFPQLHWRAVTIKHFWEVKRVFYLKFANKFRYVHPVSNFTISFVATHKSTYT